MNATPLYALIGECMIELVEGGDGRLVRGFGGDSLNTAVYLARLGQCVNYVTALGDDPYSAEMLAAWAAEGVGTDLVGRLPGRLPGLHTVRTDDKGERSFFYWRSAAAARDVFSAGGAAARLSALAAHDVIYLTLISLSRSSTRPAGTGCTRPWPPRGRRVRASSSTATTGRAAGRSRKRLAR